MARLGVCYYPEHWSEEMWPEDASRMADLGLSLVRIGEFAWSRLEPEPGRYEFDWLDRAINVLADAGLEIILGTPTATPPKWLVDKIPDMLPVDEHGHRRRFGSRRHYCFSHEGYRAQCARIVTGLAKRYGNHEAVTAWQTDNEYGCHDTTLSWSAAALAGFREWLSRKYQSPDALNRAWGNVFWSMEYRDFDEIELPIGAVTEVNPAHLMDFRRFSSDQVVSFNKLQTDIIRLYSPGRDIVHNFMGRILSFDHFNVCEDLDVASWDSYPLGFLEDRSDASQERVTRYAHTGDPDFQAFHHDLYRATGKGRWWVMEQQPGPVNWAPHNPAPRDGMVRLWSWEAFAHGAEVVSYFRWRQAPFAQEQMHSGLLRPDSATAPGFGEAARVAEEIREIGELDDTGRAEVALVFDYPSSWAWQIQPQGQEFDYFRIVLDTYRSLRRQGQSVDIIPANAPDLSGYKIVFVPALFSWNKQLLDGLGSFDGTVVCGPRSGSKTPDFSIPQALPPDLPAEILDAKVTRVESLRDEVPKAVSGGAEFNYWFEHVETGAKVTTLLSCDDESPALIRQGRFHYVCGWPNRKLMDHVVATLLDAAKLPRILLQPGLRMRKRGDMLFLMNYGDEAVDCQSIGGFPSGELEMLMGNVSIEPGGVNIYRCCRLQA